MNGNMVLAIALLAVVALVIAMRPRPDVDGEQARALVAKGAVLVDVRSPSEFAAGHIEGAINIPVGEVASRTDEIGPASTAVVVYCQSGMRSAQAKKVLAGKGFGDVHDLGSRLRW